ncbi:MAG: HAD family hydrolase [Coraliomargarita sp.]
MQHILFDLDGTLIDHFTAIHKSIAYAQQQLDLAESSYDTVRRTVGGGIELTLTRLLGESKAQEALPHFKSHFESVMLEDAIVLPGVETLLKQLKEQDKKTAVFTNKIGDHSRAILKHLGLTRHLDAVIGTADTDYRKPQPEFTQYALDRLGAKASETMMIGDSPFDYQAADCLGIPCYLVATGSHSVAQLQEETDAAGIYTNMPDLAEAVFNIQAS